MPMPFPSTQIPPARLAFVPTLCRGFASNQIFGTVPATLGSLASLNELCAPRIERPRHGFVFVGGKENNPDRIVNPKKPLIKH